MSEATLCDAFDIYSLHMAFMGPFAANPRDTFMGLKKKWKEKKNLVEIHILFLPMQ